MFKPKKKSPLYSRWRVFSITLLFFLFCINQAQADLTLQQALNSASENNSELKSYNELVKVTRSEKIKALGGFLPKISLDINDGTQKTQIGTDPRFNGKVAKRSITASQELFNGGYTVFDIKRADSEVKKDLAVRDLKERDILLSVAQVYLDLLRNEELLEISLDNLSSQQKLLELSKGKFRSRYITESELAKVEADYAVAVSNKMVIISNIRSRKASFNRLTSLKYDEVKPLKKIDQSLSEEIKKLVNSDVLELYKRAMKNNSQIKASKYSYRSAKYEALMAKSSLSPALKFNFEASKDKNSFYFNNREQRNNSAFLNLHIPIFSSGVGFATVNGTKHKERQEKYSFEAAKINLEKIISEEISKINNLESQYQSSLLVEKANKSLVKSLTIEEKLGSKSILDLLRVKRDFHTARTDRVNFHYDKILSYFRLMDLLGEDRYNF